MADRLTPMRQGGFLTFPVAAATTIEGGHMVATNSSGFAVPASSAANLKIWGKCHTRVENPGSAGDKVVVVELSGADKIFQYDIDSTSIQIDDVGKTAYAKSSTSVDLTAASQSPAGTVMAVEVPKVWILFDKFDVDEIGAS